MIHDCSKIVDEAKAKDSARKVNNPNELSIIRLNEMARQAQIFVQAATDSMSCERNAFLSKGNPALEVAQH